MGDKKGNDQAREKDWEYCRNILPLVSRTFALNIERLEIKGSPLRNNNFLVKLGLS